MAPAHNFGALLDYVIAFFLPPLGVFFKKGISWSFFINIGLTILAWIPGILHAWWLISQNEKVAQD